MATIVQELATRHPEQPVSNYVSGTASDKLCECTYIAGDNLFVDGSVVDCASPFLHFYKLVHKMSFSFALIICYSSPLDPEQE